MRAKKRWCKGLGWGCVLSIAMLAGARQAHAQADTGSISGTVQDQSGAVVPGAKVTLTSLDTGLSMSRTASNDGSYIFTPIKIGNYQVEAGDKGFKTVLHTNIRVNIQQHVVIDFTLTPGMVTQTVQVTAPPSLLQTRSGSLGQVVQARDINNLPLNGRNFTFLAQLAPGAIPAYVAGNSLGTRTTGGFIVDGIRPEQNNYMLDGLDNNNRMTGYGLGTAYVALPPVDAINEFKLQTNSYNAQFGRAAGAMLNATTKSGTNQFHGDLWEFVRNNAFDSADFFQNVAGLKIGEFRRNQFGGTVGGPVIIPHVYNGKNKTFFFFDYEGTRVRQAVPLITTVPTLAERSSGYTNFSDLISGQSGRTLTDALGRQYPIGTIFDPATTRGPYLGGQVDPVSGLTFASSCTAGNPCYARDPFPGNVIPANRLFPGSVKIFQLYPAPNLPGIFGNYGANLSSSLNDDSYDIRVDHNFSERDQFFARYSHFNAPQLLPNTFIGLLDTATVTNAMHSAVAGWTHTLSPSLVNEARVGYSRLHNATLQPDAAVNGIPASFGIPGIPQGNLNGGLPTFVIGGIGFMGSGTWQPDSEFSETTQFSDDLTKISGKHTFKGGFEYMHMAFPFDTVPFGRGRWRFDGPYTSIPGIGDGSTGRAQFLVQPIPATVPNGIDYVGGSNNLTASNAENIALSQGYYAEYFQDDWRVTPKLTLTLGIRNEYYPTYQEKYGAMSNLVPNLNWAGGQYLIPASRKSQPLSPSFLNALQTDGISLVYSNNPPLVQFPSFNWAPRFGLAYEVTPKFVARGGFGIFYGGADNQGGAPNLAENYPFEYQLVLNPPSSHQPLTPGASVGALSNGFNNLVLSSAVIPSNFISPRAIQSPYQTPSMYDANLTLQYQLGQNNSVSLGYVGTFGRHLDSVTLGNLPSVLVPPDVNPQPYVPYPDLSRGYFYTTTAANSYYHSLQVNFERRFSGGMDLIANYTYSKCRNDGGGTLYGSSEQYYRAPFVPGLGMQYDYGLCDWDTPQIVSFSGSYELPFGKGKHFLRDSHGIVNALLGGWQTNWILSLMSGEPSTIHCAISTQAAGGCFALLVPGQNKDAGQSIAHYWNAAAFADPAPVTTVGQTNYAALGGAPTQVYGPPLHRLDLSLFKEIRTSEHTHLEFRAESFNFTNTPQFGMPSYTNILDTTSFGRITSTRDSPNDARQIQFALKFYF